ncbi:hypothetical protein AA0119_g10319 [Alternaria tenuissima]|uniref:Ndc10 domain-containing protein n=1 Tax=Alternaria tenuissima TaxID=119927 RepID=A0AB37W3C7_9PLEO|nr:hypothetical protein AA0115_g10818 [Alternaria tenuissima]RYN92079.1 hypothetical protein AA0119_g10319 [Alternaria tenuissima]RYO08363.1 hypothetical protein AA0121_g11408 [Alternaria tenuissima]
MPPPITFDSSEKVRILLRYALCWGLHIDHPDFAKKLAEHGIKTARKGGDGHVAYGTIRSALTWYLGKDYSKLLPAYTIGKGESTLFEVRMRVLKHDSRDLEAALMNMNISDPARVDIFKPDSCLNMSAVHPLDGDARIEDDLLTHMNGTLEQIRQDHQREQEQARIVESQQEEAKIKSTWTKRTRREYASEGSERAKPRQHYRQNQEKIEASLQEALNKRNTLLEGYRMRRNMNPISSHEPRLNGTPPKASPLTVKVEEKNPGIQKQRHSSRESVRRREQSIKALSVCVYDNAALGDRLPTITDASSLMLSKLLRQRNPIPSGDLRQTILLPDKVRGSLSGDKLGNTPLHYYAGHWLFFAMLEIYTGISPWKEERGDIPKLNNANQSWLFTMNPEHLEHSTLELRRLIDICGSGTPWFFHSKLDACSACVSLHCVKNAPPLALQDCHGQTWLHQYLYHNEWKPEQLNARTETGKCRAVELLTLCKHYGMDPGVKDNMGRSVLDYLKPHAQSEESEDAELETEGTIFAIRDLDTGLAEHTLASWGIRTTSRVQSWATWLAEADSTSDKPLRGIEIALERAEAGAGLHDRDYYDTLGDTLLLAFINFVDPQTMPAQHVQKTLRWILVRIPRVDLRNREGLTPLQLAIHLALPHVVATLLHHISTHHGSAGSTSASEDVALQNSIQVESYQGVTLLQCLRATYWNARHSVFEGAIFVEADAIICACLITNALAGKMFDESHEFRPLRERYVFESKKRTCDAQSY